MSNTQPQIGSGMLKTASAHIRRFQSLCTAAEKLDGTDFDLDPRQDKVTLRLEGDNQYIQKGHLFYEKSEETGSQRLRVGWKSRVVSEKLKYEMVPGSDYLPTLLKFDHKVTYPMFSDKYQSEGLINQGESQFERHCAGQGDGDCSNFSFLQDTSNYLVANINSNGSSRASFDIANKSGNE